MSSCLKPEYDPPRAAWQLCVWAHRNVSIASAFAIQEEEIHKFILADVLTSRQPLTDRGRSCMVRVYEQDDHH